MGLADSAAKFAATIPAKRTAPTGFEPGVRYEGNVPVEVSLNLQAIPGDEQAYRDEIKRITKLELPDDRSVEIAQVRYWGTPGAEQIYVRFTIADRATTSEAVDYPALVKIARGNRRATPRKSATGLTRVVVVSDAQIGKTDHRGGTEELLARIENLLGQLDDEARATPCDDAVILDPGDLVEGFENTGGQLYTNALSFPSQLEMANSILIEIVSSVAKRHASTRVATVPSNHGAWRRGKDRLGRPSDDFGIMTHRTVANALKLAGRDDITFVIPDEWQESLALQVRGAVIGLAHGHQAGARPEAVPGWWAKQTHGGMALAAATIAVTGHWHHLRVQPTGAIDGKARWWFQAPTLDNGSSWWANSAGGSDTEAGLLTFTVDNEGRWDNLRLLTP